MTVKIAYASIQDGQLQMPAAALEFLPQGTPLFFFIDSEKGTVTIHAKDPNDLPNKEIWAEFTDLVADVDWRTYTEPVPEEQLRRPRKQENSDE